MHPPHAPPPAGGYVESLRIGQLPVGGPQAVGDIQLLCADPTGSGNLTIGGSDLPGLAYATVDLNSQLGASSGGLAGAQATAGRHLQEHALGPVRRG